MSYKIYHSNNLSEFINRYSTLFHSNDLFGQRVITVVQNRNIASWLKLQLTKHDGISMDLHVEYPENAVKQLVLGYQTGVDLFGYGDDVKSMLFMDSLKIVVFKTLEELLVDNRIFPNLYNYVEGSSQRLFQLSDSIAGLFYHYGMNCPLMVASWDKRELYRNADGNILRIEDQKWQMLLWNYIFNEKTPYLHISNVLNEVLNSGERYNCEISPFGDCKIVLFGSSFLGESAIKFFNYLSRDIEVHHFILTPSKIYSGETPVKPLSLLSRFSGLINGFTSISREPGFLKERTQFFKDFTGKTLLDQLKQGIKNNSLRESRGQELIPLQSGDNSLKICRVTGGWREIEVLKDKILTLMDGDNELKLTEIGVVAPEISDYSSYIEGIFPDKKILEDGAIIYGKRDLPYNIMGIKGGEESPYIRGILALLELPGSDFNRKSMLNLISNPCFMERFSITANTRDLFIETIDNLNIKWGIDGAHKKDLGYSSDDFNTWEHGFKRFLSGIALNREDSDNIPYNIGDSQGVDAVGTLVHIIRSLYSDLWNLNTLRLNMDEWVLFIETVMESYLKPVKDDLFDERERLSVKNQYRNILNLLDDLKELSNFKNRSIPFAVFKSLLKEFIVKSGSNRGRYLTQGITFSSLKPLRAVPFKHIFVLGLNEDLFPGKEKIPSYDLRGIYDQKIDLSKRQNDKFAFLELMLSAEESITLFYNGKDMVSGEELQPSVVINELIEAIELNFDCEDPYKLLVEEHPLHNFSPLYFSDSSTLHSYNRRAYESSVVYTAGKIEPQKIDLREDNSDLEQIELSISDLINFIKNPVKTFFTKGEGIYLEQIGSIEEDLYENRDLDFLSRWKLVNVVIEKGLTEDIPLAPFCDSFFNTAEIEGIYKDSLLTSNIREDVNELIADVDNFLKEQNLKGTPFKRVNRELGGEYSPFLFNIDGVDVILTGELENLWVDESDSCFTTGISLGRNRDMKLKDKIMPYIYSLIIFNHPQMRESSVTAYSIGREQIEPAHFTPSSALSGALEGIVSLYIKNLRQPIPLFPDIMESPDIDQIKQSWDKSQHETMVYSLLNDCPYVNMAYNGAVPDMDPQDIELLFDSLYRQIVSGKVKK